MKQKKIEGRTISLILEKNNLALISPERDNWFDSDRAVEQIKQLIEQTLLVKKGFADRFYEPTQEKLDRVKYQNELIEEQLKIWEKL